MKISPVFLIISHLAVIICNFNEDFKHIELTASAIAEVCEKFLINQSIEFDIIIYGRRSSQINGIVDGLLSRIGSKTAINLKYIENRDSWHHEMRKSAILFFSDELDVWKFTKLSKLSNIFPTQFKFFIYSKNFLSSYSVLRKYNKDITTVQSHQYFLMDIPEYLMLLTIEHFNDGICNEPVMTTINSFNIATESWNKNLENYEKFKNFYGCQFEVFDVFGQFLYRKEKISETSDCVKSGFSNCSSLILKESGDPNLQGIAVDLFKMMSKIGNFTLNFQFLTGDFDSFGSDVNPALRIHFGPLSLASNSEVFPTSLIDNGYFLLASTPSEFYTNYEKMWLPFDDVTWILLLFTFVAAFTVIFIVKLMDIDVRNAVLGREITTPSWNIIHIFFGISHLKLPMASIPRFILMLLILFCLIFRTCYQSKFFEFMTSDMRKPPPKTIDDLIFRNYTFVTCSEGHKVALEDIVKDQRITTKDEPNCVHLYCDNFNKVSMKLAFFIEGIQFTTFNSFCQRSAHKLDNFHKSLDILALFTHRNSFIYELLNEVLDKTISTGIPQYIMKFHDSAIYKKYEPIVDNRPKVLTLDDLSFGFILWLEFDVILYGDETDNLRDIIGLFLSYVSNKGLTNVQHVKDTDQWHHKLIKSAILFFKNEHFVLKFNTYAQLDNEFYITLKFLIFSEEVLQNEPAQRTYFDDSALIASHAFIFANLKYAIELFMYENFEEGNCNIAKRVHLNTYFKYPGRWERKLNNYAKFRNFNKCTIRITEPFGIFLYLKDKNVEVLKCFATTAENCSFYMTYYGTKYGLQGFIIDLFDIVSKYANFTPFYQLYVYNITGPDYNRVYPRIMMNLNTFGNATNPRLFDTPLLLSGEYMFAVSPSDFYTNFEKLWLPFDDITWTLLLLTFVVAFTIIAVVKCTPKFFRNAVFGHEIQTPALNVFHIFFGISQMKLPVGSNPRFILILFIAFCLIFRTCYQSKSFEFLTTDMRKPPPNTVEDLIVDDYTVYVCDSGHDVKYCESLGNSKDKAAFFIEDIQYSVFNYICGGAAIRMRDFRLEIPMTAMFIMYNSFLYEFINDILWKLIPAGIPQHLIDYHALNLHKKYEPFSDLSPKVLKLADLSFGFVLWAVACGFSVVGFIFEYFQIQFQKYSTNLIGLWIFIRVLLLRLRVVVM
ncbi:unnamed protein product [Chironomus riparius]|uniref:Ionotropic receptor n=1 Tax=Chironomus riparius TaxID=315576 RepID=A0A9N9S460_9DIPT|nr:unnamed protein product [Chironomus riparius]